MGFKKREKLLNESFDSMFEELLLEDLESVRKKYPDIDDNTFYRFVESDPTYKPEKDNIGSYGKWLLDLYKRDSTQFDNYSNEYIKEILTVFHDKKIKRKIDVRDIYQFKTFDSFVEFIESLPETELTKNQRMALNRKAKHNSELDTESKLIYEDENWEVRVPLTKAASCRLGSGTKWCTATTADDNRFDAYSRNGNLHIFINKNNPEEKYQVTVSFDGQSYWEFNNKNNKRVDYNEISHTFPDVKDVPALHKIYEEIHKYDDVDFNNYIYDGSEIPEDFKHRIKGITVKDGVTKIRNNAFYGCKSLKSINIPDSVTEIGAYAFSHCRSLTSITIPNNVTEIGAYAFYRCESLESIIIPDSVTGIGYGAFENCINLKSITIPNGVIEIGKYAFENCKSLESINIPNSVIEIGNSAFYDCESLKSITIPDSVTEIGKSAFLNCKSLKSINIPDSVIEIKDYAFYGCPNLTIYTDSSVAIEYAEENNVPYKPLSEYINESYRNILRFKLVESIH